jgi:CRP-like cAMP-binding protein
MLPADDNLRRSAAPARPFLATLAPRDAAELRRRVRERDVRAHEVLLCEGAYADDVMLLLDGMVKLTARGTQGGEVILATFGPGELFGELAAIDGTRRSASVIALEPGRAGFLSAAGLREFCIERPQVALVLMRTMACRLREANRLRVEESTHDGLGRVAGRLLYLAERHGDHIAEGLRVDLPMTQDELASWTGVSRQTVARALRLMRTLGWISTARGSVTLRNLPALRARVGTS